jgi:hypothetical protein
VLIPAAGRCCSTSSEAADGDTDDPAERLLAEASIARVAALADIVHPGHDRVFRIRPLVAEESS